MQSFQHHISVIDVGNGKLEGNGSGIGMGSENRFLWANLCGYHKSLGSIVDWATSFGHLCRLYCVRMCVCGAQINISLDPGNFMRLGYSNMQSSCAAIWRLYGHRFNREIFRPTEKSKLICHLPLKSFLPVAAMETTAGIAVAISSVSISSRQRMQIAVPSILSLPPLPRLAILPLWALNYFLPATHCA